ncbi:transporter substrate-binding domain-containing protein [Methyloligella solikamskensis]|uniref:Transporter substrate-binding domain-containing protein n=1 Tax=Methyloligella solikamskensis TaxID=1177756 RepID=A0ABW3JD79_9HYPH
MNDRETRGWRRRLRAGATVLGLLALTAGFALGLAPGLTVPAAAQTQLVPDVWQGDVVPQEPKLGDREKLRFLTDSDYPPFHYFDEEGVLTGFNVDLARAICEVLEVECEIEEVDWDDLFAQLESGEADAAIASIRIDSENRRKADFTQRYYATPARFIAAKDSEITDPRPETLKGVKVAVMEGTGHAAYLKAYFPDAEVITFSSAEAANGAVKDGTAELAFGDGIGLTFWLNGVTSDGCCEFRGGPYMDATFFGEGVGIAVPKGDRKMLEILNYALYRVHADGRYEELLLRYFPMSFF